MKREQDEKTPGSWLRSVRAESPAANQSRLESAIRTLPDPEGWDPFEVWLRCIHRPRSTHDSGKR